jgi:DNA-binding MarR family transcriptional regulator
MKSKSKLIVRGVEDRQAVLLHQCISALMREFRIEPGLLAGSIYAGLHASDVGLFEVLASAENWNVHRIARSLSAPMTTISSALDRLERQGLIARRRINEDRRVVRIELTSRGRRLANRLQRAHVENCRAMLERLKPTGRDAFLRLAAQISGI